jgi:hypothetical protein
MFSIHVSIMSGPDDKKPQSLIRKKIVSAIAAGGSRACGVRVFKL